METQEIDKHYGLASARAALRRMKKRREKARKERNTAQLDVYTLTASVEDVEELTTSVEDVEELTTRSLQLRLKLEDAQRRVLVKTEDIRRADRD